MGFILLILSLILFPLGHLGRISFFSQEVNLYLYEIPMALSLAFFIFTYKLDPLDKLWHKYKIIFLFFACMLVSYVISFGRFSYFENVVAFLYFIRLVFYTLTIIYSTYYVYLHKNQKKLILVVEMIFMVILLVSFLQFFLYPDLRNLIYLGWDPHLYRAFGTFFDPPVTAGIFGLITLYFFLKKTKRGILLSVISLILFVMTYSRGAYLALAVSAGIYLFLKKRYLLLAATIGFCLFVFVLLPKPYGESVNLGRLFSIQSRLSDYNEGIRIWKESPLIGIGYNRIRYEKEKTPETFDANHAGASFHSSFLVILVTGGIIGLVLFLGILYKVWGMGEFTKVAVVFISIISLTDNVLLHPFILYLLFWTTLIFRLNYLSGRSR